MLQIGHGIQFVSVKRIRFMCPGDVMMAEKGFTSAGTGNFENNTTDNSILTWCLGNVCVGTGMNECCVDEHTELGC